MSKGRKEFTKATKLMAWTRCGGRCESCDAKLGVGKHEFHHDKECTFGGDNGLGNCVVLCLSCHGMVTSGQATVIAKSNRQRNKNIGIKKAGGRPMPGSKASGLRKRMDGRVERR